MAPSSCSDITFPTLTGTEISASSHIWQSSNPTDINLSNYYYKISYYTPQRKVETDKERITRISKEKMYASWKVYDEMRKNVLKVRQVCKPQHRLIFR